MNLKKQYTQNKTYFTLILYFTVVQLAIAKTGVSRIINKEP